ncbi:hypothetical protein F7R06_23315, partial [Pseudomonas moorei]
MKRNKGNREKMWAGQTAPFFRPWKSKKAHNRLCENLAICAALKENAPYRKIRSIFRYGLHPGRAPQPDQPVP